MEEVTPATLHAMVSADLGPELSGYVRRIFGPFEFDGIEVAPPTRTFEGDARAPRRRPAGRAHRGRPGPHRAATWSRGRPAARVVFAGDILFIGGTPIVWAGPLANWVAALERILASTRR